MAAILRADEGGMVRRIRAALRGAFPAWTGIQQDPMVREGKDTWLPHMSLAYYNTEHDNRAVVDALAPFRDVLIAEMFVQQVQLISTPTSFTSTEERWSWLLHAVFQLQGRP
jgi:hypothetical protein